jgi:hypothetical protein
MGPYIDEARAKIRAIAAELSTGTPKPDVKFGLVAFRDRGDTFVTQVTPFTPDVEAMHRAIDATEAGGGGDTPESVFEGVRDAVTRLKWTPPEDPSVIRLVYVVGDAPPQHPWAAPSEVHLRRGAGNDVSRSTGSSARRDRTSRRLRDTPSRVFSLTGPGRMSAAGAARDTLVGALTDHQGVFERDRILRGRDVPAIAVEALAVPDVPVTGLIGRHVLWVETTSPSGTSGRRT